MVDVDLVVKFKIYINFYNLFVNLKGVSVNNLMM